MNCPICDKSVTQNDDAIMIYRGEPFFPNGGSKFSRTYSHHTSCFESVGGKFYAPPIKDERISK